MPKPLLPSSGYETFEHTADIGIRAWGRGFSELFEEAAKALFSVICNLDTVSAREHFKIELTAETSEELLLAWLKELLYLLDTKKLLLSEFKVTYQEGDRHLPAGRKASVPFSMSAEVAGELLDNAKHELGREVKAVTYHQFKLSKGKARYTAEVILDI